METLLNILRGFLKKTGRFELLLCKLLLSWIVVLTGISILLRYGFNYSLHWSQEITLLSAQYLYFIGAAYIFKAKEYIIMDFFFNKIPVKLKIPTVMMIHMLMMAFLGVAIWQAFLMIRKQWDTTSFVLDLPRGHWTIPVLIGCLSIMLTLIYYMLVYYRHWQLGDAGANCMAKPDAEMNLGLGLRHAGND